eukprot:TRINITY_DN33039_c0_g1_i3.p1 TRINITY_DN33039_c0_g1~~TRINITY_DN33039_c0_g1_i3.p1  ORF type:complete len:175 (-),score=32.73 TRINITY_DN33039_c0_g1_i3:9-533(-)
MKGRSIRWFGPERIDDASRIFTGLALIAAKATTDSQMIQLLFSNSFQQLPVSKASREAASPLLNGQTNNQAQPSTNLNGATQNYVAQNKHLGDAVIDSKNFVQIQHAQIQSDFGQNIKSMAVTNEQLIEEDENQIEQEPLPQEYFLKENTAVGENEADSEDDDMAMMAKKLTLD